MIFNVSFDLYNARSTRKRRRQKKFSCYFHCVPVLIVRHNKAEEKPFNQPIKFQINSQFLCSAGSFAKIAGRTKIRYRGCLAPGEHCFRRPILFKNYFFKYHTPDHFLVVNSNAKYSLPSIMPLFQIRINNLPPHFTHMGK